MATAIPDALAKMARDRRVIPFVGAGFSATLGLPGWKDLLKGVADHLRISETDPKMTFEDVEKAANGDFLRIAEYLYLRAGSAIGPLRLQMTTAMQAQASPITSGVHVELVNLGAPRVYTTNFDNLIEYTYQNLGEPVEVVALSRDVATTATENTQVVKYHGDLGHDPTLVLTESQYYRRLDFESPMDLKFRSDLLGRSVLFIGYSFSDINIRVIWFKLMQMMRDVPERDRPPSYIVRLQPDPVLEALDEHVGLRTVVLDPTSEASSDAERSELLARFVADLADAAAGGGVIPGTNRQMFVSANLLDRLQASLSKQREQVERRRFTGPSPEYFDELKLLQSRRVPLELRNRAKEIVLECFRLTGPSIALRYAPGIVRWALDLCGPNTEITYFIGRGLMSSSSRDVILGSDIPWSEVWTVQLSQEHAAQLVRTAQGEIAGHETGGYADLDVAYAVDVLKRLTEGLTDSEEAISASSELLERAVEMYPSVATYEPEADGAPNPTAVEEEIQDRVANSQEPVAYMDEDPF